MMPRSAPRHRPYDSERLTAVRHRVRKLCLGIFVGEVLFAGEEADERSASARRRVAHGTACSIGYAASSAAGEGSFELASPARPTRSRYSSWASFAQMLRKGDADHGRL